MLEGNFISVCKDVVLTRATFNLWIYLSFFFCRRFRSEVLLFVRGVFLYLSGAVFVLVLRRLGVHMCRHSYDSLSDGPRVREEGAMCVCAQSHTRVEVGGVGISGDAVRVRRVTAPLCVDTGRLEWTRTNAEVTPSSANSANNRNCMTPR